MFPPLPQMHCIFINKWSSEINSSKHHKVNDAQSSLLQLIFRKELSSKQGPLHWSFAHSKCTPFSCGSLEKVPPLCTEKFQAMNLHQYNITQFPRIVLDIFQTVFLFELLLLSIQILHKTSVTMKMNVFLSTLSCTCWEPNMKPREPIKAAAKKKRLSLPAKAGKA